QELHPEPSRRGITEIVHGPEFPGGIDVQQRKGGYRRVERLDRQVQHHRAVLADRVQHDRPLTLRNHLTHDVDALSLEPLQVREERGRCWGRWWLTHGEGSIHAVGTPDRIDLTVVS